MKVSRAWLQKYFEQPLPDTATLADAFTFHAFEIESFDDDLLDIKVLPDRAAYALSHRGIAKELAAILALPMISDPLRNPLATFEESRELKVVVDSEYVVRHTGAIIRGVSVGQSPAWLRTALEAVGQRSINNVVDVLNYVMLDIGQPSGAFDLAALTPANGVYTVDIRRAQEGECIRVLTGEEHTLTSDMWMFTDAEGGELLDIAGIKGGLSSGVTEKTTDLFLSVGNYDATRLRRASQKLKLFTDASLRFQNRPSPQLTMYGMNDLLVLLTSLTGGTSTGIHDVGLRDDQPRTVSIKTTDIESLLGSSYTKEEVRNAFTRLGFEYTVLNDTCTVTSPWERNDIVIPEDLIEEVGRVYGYDRVEPIPLIRDKEVNHALFRGIEKVKDELVSRGYTEVSTQSFSKKGDIKLANPLDASRPFLRTEILLTEATTHAKTVAPLFRLNSVKLFEVGTVFTKDHEHLAVGLSDTGEPALPPMEDLSYSPKRYTLSSYCHFSPYPFVLRDIAVWTPAGTRSDAVKHMIEEQSGELLSRIDLFDTFTKEGRTSYAFHLVFQSFDRTLSDEEINPIMERCAAYLKAQNGFEVR